MLRKDIFARVLAASILAIPTLGNAAEPLKIRIDWSTTPGQFAPLIPTVPKYAPDVYKHYGKSYVVEPIRLQGGGANLTALAANEIDISTLSPPNLASGVNEAKLELRVIGSQIATGVAGYLSTDFFVRAGEISRLEDLKGKVVGVNARGANVEAATMLLLRKIGLEEPRDYQIAEVRFPAMIAALESKRIDVAPMVPPFHLMAEKNPAFKKLYSVHDAFGEAETLMFIAKADYVAKHRAALVDFLEDNIRMRAWMSDPKTRPAALKQLSDTTRLPVTDYEEWVYTKKDYYYHPQAMIDAKRLQRNINTMKETGMIPATIDVDRYVDMTLASEAAARIK